MTQRLRRTAAVAGIALALTVGAATPAFATVHNESDTQTRWVTHNATQTVVKMESRKNGDHQAVYVQVVKGPLEVQARAKCARRDGGTRWYQSTIAVGVGQGASHYDCDNNGTYNFELVGMGVDFLD
ncbi:hypothetical protein [Pseudonocardia pini]|uniref:hypothetical protein n=1 Tax=Pseudonocardia pini TaxID=2758030 RepID=UPI0015EFEC35|nr:hypothetical protein [Pseudonocardia pini]